MIPVNAPARKSTFFSYLLLQLLLIGLVAAIIFTGVSMPVLEVARLKEEHARYERDQTSAAAFAGKTGQVKNLLDSVKLTNAQTPILEGKIEDCMKEMSAVAGHDSAAGAALYQDVITIVANLKEARKQVRDLTEKNAGVSEYQQKINELTAENTRLQMQLSAAQPPAAVPGAH